MTNFEDISTVSELIDRPKNISSDPAAHLENQISIECHPQTGFDPEQLVPTQTYVECGVEKLTALCESVGLSHKIDQITNIFRSITTSWGNRAVGDTAWQSDVSDDATPFEFSIALDPDNVELRVLVEAQGSEASLQSNWQAGIELNQYLAANHSVNLDRFEQIADLYAPTNSTAKFSIWHAVCFYPDKEPAFKLYLNPQSQSQSRSAAIVEESLVRLGFTHAWPTLAETSAQRGPDKDEFVYFSLDLAAHTQARVKVYLRHHDATPAQLESALSAARNDVSGDAIEFCQAMAPGQTSFSAKSAITCFSFIAGDDDTPSNGTLYLPISNYATDDRVVCDRLDLYFIEHGLPVSRYQSSIQSFAVRSLASGIGMHSYVSFRREQHQRRISIYLNPEANTVRSPGKISAIKSKHLLNSVEEMVWKYYEENTLAHHPFLQRLQREAVNPQHLWLVFMNFHEAVNHFTRRLAVIIARVDDERIRCLLASQLNEELGSGNIEHNHKKLFDRLIANIEPWKIESFTEEMLIPGKEFSQSLDKIYSAPDSDPYGGVGAGILMEIQAEQFDRCLANECRKTDIDLSAITWLILHEEIEADHADESVVIARLADDSSGGLAAIEGSRNARTASWKLLNDLYRLCYCAIPLNVRSI
jgi:DMATS type aromatic prenyltransferase